MICHYTCRHCGAEIECNVIINEEDDLPSECPTCNRAIPDDAHDLVHTQAMEKALDRPDLD